MHDCFQARVYVLLAITLTATLALILCYLYVIDSMSLSFNPTYRIERSLLCWASVASSRKCRDRLELARISDRHLVPPAVLPIIYHDHLLSSFRVTAGCGAHCAYCVRTYGHAAIRILHTVYSMNQGGIPPCMNDPCCYKRLSWKDRLGTREWMYDRVEYLVALLLPQWSFRSDRRENWI